MLGGAFRRSTYDIAFAFEEGLDGVVQLLHGKRHYAERLANSPGSRRASQIVGWANKDISREELARRPRRKVVGWGGRGGVLKELEGK